MGSFVVIIQVFNKTFFRKPDRAVGVLLHVRKRRELKEVRHGQDARLEEKVVSAFLGGRHEEDAKGRGVGVLNREAVPLCERGGDVRAEAPLLVIGDVGEKFVGELLRGFGAHVHFEEKESEALAARFGEVEAVRVEGQAALVFFAAFLVRLGETHFARNTGVPGARAEPEREAGFRFRRKCERGIEIGDGEFMSERVFGEGGAVFRALFEVPQLFIEFGAAGSFELGEDRAQVVGFQEPDGGRFRESGPLGRSDRDPIPADEAVRVEAAQDVREILDAREFLTPRRERAVDLLGRHEPKPEHGFEDREVEGGEGEVHKREIFVLRRVSSLGEDWIPLLRVSGLLGHCGASGEG